MKPTSIIFIIVSVLLACVGVLLMVTASNMADTQGISLFTQTGDSDNNFTASYEIDDENIKKLSIDVSNVTVNVYGNAKQSKIELVNFPEGTFDLTTGKTTMTLADKTDISNIVDLDNLKINFNGFRDYLHYFQYKDKEKTVNVYFSDECSVTIFSLSTAGDVTLEDLNNNCDYRVKVGKGNVSVTNLTTNSSLTVNSTDDSNITLNTVEANDIEINGINAFATMKRLSFSRSLYVKILSGGVDYDAGDFTGFKLKFQTDSGIITYGSHRILNDKYEEDLRLNIPDTPDPNKETDSSAIEPTQPQNSSQVESDTVTIYVAEGDIKVY